MTQIDVDVDEVHRRAARMGVAAADLAACILRSSRAFAAIGTGSGDPGVLQAALTAEARWRHALTAATAGCAALASAGTSAADAYGGAEQAVRQSFDRVLP